MGSRPRQVLPPPSRLNTDGGIRAFHGLTPTAKCCRRLRGSVGTPGPALGDYHYLNRRPSGVWQFLRQGLSVELRAAAAFAAQHCAELSMGSRPRLSAVAAFAAQRDGGIRFHGLTPTAKCCRRLRGSTGMGASGFPWAHGHGYLRTPRSRLFGTPGLTPGGLSIKNPVPAAPGGRRIPRRRLVAKKLIFLVFLRVPSCPFVVLRGLSTDVSYHWLEMRVYSFLPSTAKARNSCSTSAWAASPEWM